MKNLTLTLAFVTLILVDLTSKLLVRSSDLQFYETPAHAIPGYALALIWLACLWVGKAAPVGALFIAAGATANALTTVTNTFADFIQYVGWSFNIADTYLLIGLVIIAIELVRRDSTNSLAVNKLFHREQR